MTALGSNCTNEDQTQSTLKLDSFVDKVITPLVSAVYALYTMPLLEDLHIISLANTGLSSAEIVNQVEQNVHSVERVFATCDRITKYRTPNPSHCFLGNR